VSIIEQLFTWFSTMISAHMKHCVVCGTPTALHVGGVPLCMECDDKCTKKDLVRIFWSVGAELAEPDALAYFSTAVFRTVDLKR
jgi:hypothetical protein